MALFPEPQECQQRIIAWDQKSKGREVAALGHIQQCLRDNQSTKGLISVQQSVVATLGRWQAVRGRKGVHINRRFIEDFAENSNNVKLFFEIFNIVRNSSDLSEILQHRESLKQLYDEINTILLCDNVSPYIVTTSKTLLILLGLNVGVDKRVRNALKSKFPQFAIHGVWEFDLFYELLKYLSQEARDWRERYNMPITGLIPGVPVGQIMDRILFMK